MKTMSVNRIASNMNIKTNTKKHNRFMKPIATLALIAIPATMITLNNKESDKFEKEQSVKTEQFVPNTKLTKSLPFSVNRKYSLNRRIEFVSEQDPFKSDNEITSTSNDFDNGNFSLVYGKYKISAKNLHVNEKTQMIKGQVIIADTSTNNDKIYSVHSKTDEKGMKIRLTDVNGKHRDLVAKIEKNENKENLLNVYDRKGKLLHSQNAEDSYLLKDCIKDGLMKSTAAILLSCGLVSIGFALCENKKDKKGKKVK